MSKQINRRDFLKFSGAAIAAGAASAAGATTAIGRKKKKAEAPAVATHQMAALPQAKGPRLVILGGGTSGLTIAKHAKKAWPKFDVVLVEKRDMYSSCFSSNLWYPGLIDLEFLAGHSFLDAAVNNDYIYFNATATGLDRESRRLVTNKGAIAYDFLVVAPGISYDFEKIGVTDPGAQLELAQRYPGGFARATEHVTLRRKAREFEGGIFIQTVPSGNYRCLPAPYERACLLAGMLKKNKIKGKVVVLDANPEVTIKAEGFHAAFDELYKDHLEWVSSAQVTGIDLDKRIVKTEFDEYEFADASIYPNVRGARLIEQLGLMGPTSRTTQKEADIDIRFYNHVKDPRVFVTGDSRPHPYSKSANTSNSEGHYVARLLAARAQDKEIEWTSPETICYSVVNADPMQAIWVDAHYVYDKDKDEIAGFSPDTKVYNERSEANGLATLEWARGLYRDMFNV